MIKKQNNKKIKLKIKNLIRFGYFPEELPPVFTTKSFSQTVTKIGSIKSSDRISEPVVFSIPKKQMHRRKLMIPNPSHYLDLCNVIVTNQSKILKHVFSKNSSSVPNLNKSSLESIRPFAAKETYSEFLWNCFKLSHGMNYELNTDISRFYPTIYTHTIAWVIHGKEYAKNNIYNDKLLGNQLDKKLRNMQSGQTFGIPVGPDASNLVAELICSCVDDKIRNKFPGIRFRRYRDDYKFYFRIKNEGDEILRFFEVSLGEYLLEKNEEKTTTKETPVSVEQEWIFVIREFIIRPEGLEQKEDLVSLFSLILRYARQFPDSQVVKYSFYKFGNAVIVDDNVELYFRLLFRLVELDSRAMKEISILLMKYCDKVSKKVLKQELKILLNKYVEKDNTFEILWLLWISKVFKLKIDNLFARKVFSGTDSLSILMLLNMRDEGLVSKKIGISRILDRIKRSNFNSDWWLLKYQAYLNKWVKLSSVDPFFKLIKTEKVSFFDNTIISLESSLKQKKKSYKSLIMSFGGSNFY